MTQNARVIKLLDNGLAEISVQRSSACSGSCAECGGCSVKKPLIVTAKNNISARAGDLVIVSTKTSKIVFAAFVVYIVPFIMFFAGYGISAALKASEQVSILLSACAFLVGMLCAFWLNRTVKKRRSFDFEIKAFTSREK
jgi:sigma-E factor negative regulatory protein RseC